MIPLKLARPAALVGAGAVVGMLAGWALWHPKPPKVETYAPAIRQPDQSLVLERRPQADAKPAQVVPKGAKVERIVQVTVLPNLPSTATGGLSTPASGIDPASPCPPVTVDLTLLRMQDQTLRVVASSPDGRVVGGVDIPTVNVAPARAYKWAVGGSYNPGQATYGVWAQRSAGPFVLGVQAYQERLPIIAGGGVRVQAQVLVGLRF